MRKLVVLIICGIPALLFVLIAYKGFVNDKRGLVVVSLALALVCILGCLLAIKEVTDKEEKEAA